MTLFIVIIYSKDYYIFLGGFVDTSKVTRNYQITIPRDIRRRENIRVGDVVVFVPTEKGVEMKKASRSILDDTFGMWKGMKASSVSHVRRLRGEAERREKRLGI